MTTATKQTHTPGPWTTSPQQGYVRHLGTHGPNICAMDVFGGPAEEAFANARLIAAAPEMLEALDGLIYELDGVMDDPNINDWLVRAKAAIQKARGRQ